jgi:type IV pilus assembly protein PilV
MKKSGMKQKGVTLIEVLVSVLVISVGLLGIAGLNVFGLTYSNSAYQRSQATQLAYDIIDRMRANRAEAEKVGSGYAVSLGVSYSSSSACENGTCDPSQMAVYDKANWKAALANNLPGGDGSVAIDTATKLVTVTVQWSDAIVSGGLQTRGNKSFTFRTEL